MKRRAVTHARKKRACEYWRWTTPTGDMVGIEGGKIVTVKDGRPVEFDHRWSLALGGPDDDENLAPLHPDDHKAKTAKDASARAKVRRLRGETGQKPKRAWPKRKLASRPFQKRSKGDAG